MSPRGRSRPGRALALLVVPALAGACGTPMHREPVEAWPVESRPLALNLKLPQSHRRVVVGDLRVIERPEEPPPPAVDGAAGEDAPPPLERIPVDGPALREALRELLASSAAFDAVEMPGADAAGAPGDEGRTGPGSAALPSGSGLLIETEVKDALLARDRKDDSKALSVGAWFTLGFFASWLPDQQYVLGVEPTFVIRDLASRKELGRLRTSRSEERASLALVHRRPGPLPLVGTLLLLPHFAFDSASGAVTGSLGPMALKRPARELLEDLAAFRAGRRVARATTLSVPRELRVELLAPRAGDILAGGKADVKLAVHVSPALNARLREVRAGETRVDVAGSGGSASVTLGGVDVVPGALTHVWVHLTTGEPLAVAEIEVVDELVRPD